MPRPRRIGVGLGNFDIPYDQSGGTMPGFNIPDPGGSMKKLSLEFADAQDAAAASGQPQVPPGAVLPPGAQGDAVPQPAMQPAPQEPPQGPQGDMFGMLAGGADQFGQGPDSGMFSDDQLMAMAGDDPTMQDPAELEAEEMHGALMDPNMDPQMLEELRMRLLQAAQRQGGF